MSARKLQLLLSVVAAAALVAVGGAAATRGMDAVSGWPLAVHTAAKWILLGATVWLSIRNATTMDTGQPIGHAWLLFGLGVGAFLLGEVGEAVYQFVLGILNPFPSLLDVFYVAGYPLLIGGLSGFLRAYAAVGYPMGTLRGSALVVAVLVVVGLALVWPVLSGIAGPPSPVLEKVLAAAYPLLDIALLVSVALLLRGARRFGGGRAWEVWALVLAGLGVMIAGDLRYAYFAAGGEEHVDALSEMLFVVAYLLLALGALKQKELTQG